MASVVLICYAPRGLRSRTGDLGRAWKVFLIAWKGCLGPTGADGRLDPSLVVKGCLSTRRGSGGRGVLGISWMGACTVVMRGETNPKSEWRVCG